MSNCGCKNKAIGTVVTSLYIVGSRVNKSETESILRESMNYSEQQAKVVVDMVDTSGKFMLFEGSPVKVNELSNRLRSRGIMCNVMKRKV